jgi:hypothetical protein
MLDKYPDVIPRQPFSIRGFVALYVTDLSLCTESGAPPQSFHPINTGFPLSGDPTKLIYPDPSAIFSTTQ